jgi:hypothetical protein
LKPCFAAQAEEGRIALCRSFLQYGLQRSGTSRNARGRDYSGSRAWDIARGC